MSIFDRFIKTKADQAVLDVISIVAIIFGAGALIVWLIW